jgi:heat shock protein HtpX
MAIFAGAVANWVMITIAVSVWYDFTDGHADNATAYSAWWALLLMGILAGTALTPFGESFFRFLEGCRRPIRSEEAKLRPIFTQVCQTANLDPEKYELYVSDGKFTNAFSIGRRTVCVTRLLLNECSVEELQGVLAHELGHHVYGDAMRAIIFYMITLAGQMIMFGGAVIIKILHLLTFIAGYGENGNVKHYAQIFSIFGGILGGVVWCFQIFVWVPISIGSYFGTRQQEYRADRYAAEIGYCDGLLVALDRLLDAEGQPSGFMGLLCKTHPKVGDRIRKLEDFSIAQAGIPLAQGVGVFSVWRNP